jgi:hypothetical protein
MPLKCSSCGAAIARQDCHRNRYAEFICRKCQRAGVRFTWRGRLRYWSRQTRVWILFGLMLLVAAGMIGWAIYRSLNSY